MKKILLNEHLSWKPRWSGPCLLYGSQWHFSQEKSTCLLLSFCSSSSFHEWILLHSRLMPLLKHTCSLTWHRLGCHYHPGFYPVKVVSRIMVYTYVTMMVMVVWHWRGIWAIDKGVSIESEYRESTTWHDLPSRLDCLPISAPQSTRAFNGNIMFLLWMLLRAFLSLLFLFFLFRSRMMLFWWWCFMTRMMPPVEMLLFAWRHKEERKRARTSMFDMNTTLSNHFFL